MSLRFIRTNNFIYLRELCRLSLYRPHYLPLTIKTFSHYVKRYLKNKFFNYNKVFENKKCKKNKIPLKIANFVRAIPEIHINKNIFTHLPRFPEIKYNFAIPDDHIKRIEISLASHAIIYSDKLYDLNFQDSEDTMAVHRFVWLLKLLDKSFSKEIIEFGLAQILKWCESSFDKSDSKRFGTYTICERLVSWLFFLMLVQNYINMDDDCVIKFKKSFEAQINLIINNLEYYGEDTNNHILNNGKALYLCGRILNLDYVAGLGREIFYLEYDKMVENGILREGSSHYQMLLTKSLIEIFYIAELTKDQNFSQWIKPRLKKMFIICDQLQSRFDISSMPLFGDISPDMGPEWLTGYPFIAKYEKASGWFNLLFKNHRNFLNDVMAAEDKFIGPNQAQFAPVNAWHYLKKGFIEIWVMAKNKGVQHHGHNDNGAIVVFYKGKPIIADAGLKSYAYDDISLNQLSHLGHNVPLIDDVPSDIGRETILNSNYLTSKFKLVQLKEDQIEYEITYFNGFFKLSRTIKLKENSIEIIDMPASSISAKLNYKNMWHFLDNFQDDNCFMAKNKVYFNSGNSICLESSAAGFAAEKYKSIISQSYGAQTEVSSLQIEADMYEGNCIALKLQFNEK